MTDEPTFEVPDGVPDPMRDAVVAVADLVGRTGATGIEFGNLHDDVPNDQAGWYATAIYRGAKQWIEGRNPADVADRLARKLIHGGVCTRCKRTATVGRPHPAQCRWQRYGDKWMPECMMAALAAMADANKQEGSP